MEPVRIWQSAYLDHRIGKDHRAIERRVHSMPGFKSTGGTRVIPSVIEMVRMMREGQANYACHSNLSRAERFELLAA